MKIYVIFLFSLVLISCGTDENANESTIIIEKFPSVNLKDYDTIQFEDKLEFVLPYEYSISQVKGENTVLSYSHLVDEVTIELCQYDKKQFQNSIDARGIKVGKDSLFIEFANESYENVIGNLKDVDQQEKYYSTVNKLKTRYFRVTCKSEGFPFKQSLSIRFYEDNNYYYAIHFLSLAKDADELTDIEDAMMLSFKTK